MFGVQFIHELIERNTPIPILIELIYYQAEFFVSRKVTKVSKRVLQILFLQKPSACSVKEVERLSKRELVSFFKS